MTSQVAARHVRRRPAGPRPPAPRPLARRPLPPGLAGPLRRLLASEAGTLLLLAAGALVVGTLIGAAVAVRTAPAVPPAPAVRHSPTPAPSFP